MNKKQVTYGAVLLGITALRAIAYALIGITLLTIFLLVRVVPDHRDTTFIIVTILLALLFTFGCVSLWASALALRSVNWAKSAGIPVGIDEPLLSEDILSGMGVTLCEDRPVIGRLRQVFSCCRHLRSARINDVLVSVHVSKLL